MKYTYYNLDSGEIIGIIDCPDPVLAHLHLTDKTWIAGEYNSDQYYIEQSNPVSMPTKPVDGFDYNFTWTTKSWVLDQDKTSNRIRNTRNLELSIVDRVNPVWFSTLTVEQQSELAAYRQALLDVPQQTGFPTQVNWPAKPTWI